MKKNKQRYNTIIKIGFVIYIILVLTILLFKAPTDIAIWKSEPHRLPVKLVPFETIIFYVRNVHSFTDWFIKNLAANVIMFVPWGIFVPVIIKNSKTVCNISHIKLLCITVISAIIFSAIIEMIQYVWAVGQLDVDDVILNTLGSLIGMGILLIIEILFRKIKK